MMEERTLRRSESCLLDSGVGESGEVEVPSCCEPPTKSPKTRQTNPGTVSVCAGTIRQHYYPEGGWGWVVVFCAVLVQCITHGIQLSWGILDVQVRKKFVRISPTDTGRYLVKKIIFFFGR